MPFGASPSPHPLFLTSTIHRRCRRVRPFRRRQRRARIMPNEPMTRTAVVVGATGIIGRAIAAKLAELGGWRVIGATQSGGTVPGVDEAIAVDLRDPEEARRRLAAASGATHLFFAAYLPQGN